MHGQVRVLMEVNGRPKTIFTRVIIGDDANKIRKDAMEIAVRFAEENPHIKIAYVELTMSEIL